MRWQRTLLHVTLAVTLLAAAIAAMSGCDNEPVSDGNGEAENPGPPVAPSPAVLSSPEDAVASYLDWVSFAYRTASSDVASHTMTAWEGVRVDSYIELNRQQGQAIEQELTLFRQSSLESIGTTATLVAYEEWDYRYFSMESGEYVSEPLTASYDSTYTVVRIDDTWLVDSVDVTALGEVE